MPLTRSLSAFELAMEAARARRRLCTQCLEGVGRLRRSTFRLRSVEVGADRAEGGVGRHRSVPRMDFLRLHDATSAEALRAEVPVGGPSSRVGV